jgi:hypothetical protein
MKLHLLSIALVSCFSIADAQISINQNHMPSANEQFNYRLTGVLPGSVDPAATGEGMTWDYSALDQGLAMVDSFFTVGSAPFTYQIFFNNQLFYPNYKADYARRDADVNFGLVNLTNTFVFYKNNAQGLRNLGYGAEVNGIPTPVQNDPIDYIYEFPLNYQDAFTGHSESEVAIPTLGYFHRSLDRSTIVEGYGTLNLPGVSYEVLKVKVILNASDSIYIEQFGSGFNIDQPEETIYQWLATEHIEPVLEISQQIGFGYSVRYLSPIVSSVMEEEAVIFNLSPVPANGTLRVEIVNQGAYSYEIIDMTGKVLESERIPEGMLTHLISVGTMIQGVYLITLSDQNTGVKYLRTFIKE